MGNRKQRRQIKRLFKKVSNIILRKKDPRNQTLQDLFASFNNNFEAPEDFQRPLSWGKEQKEKLVDIAGVNAPPCILPNGKQTLFEVVFLPKKNYHLQFKNIITSKSW